MPSFPTLIHSFDDNHDVGHPSGGTTLDKAYMNERDWEIEAIEAVLGADLTLVPGAGRALSHRVRVRTDDVLDMGVIEPNEIAGTEGSAGEQLRIGPAECGHTWLALEKDTSDGPVRIQCYETSDPSGGAVAQDLVLQPEGSYVTKGTATATIKPLMQLRATDAGMSLENTGNQGANLDLDANRSSPGQFLGRIGGLWNNADVAEIGLHAGNDPAEDGSKDDGEIAFYTSDDSNNMEERVRIAQEGGIFMKAYQHPTIRPGKAAVYARNTAGSAEVWVVDDDVNSNATQISPHDPETGEWIYRSESLRTGKTVRVKMEEFVRAVEELSGETLMVHGTLDDEERE